MPSFNRVTLIGNLTRDPQIKHLRSDTTVAEFGLAMNRRFKTAAGENREEVTFVDCTAFGKQADVIGQYCKKGKPLFVEGRLKLDQWEDKAGGGKRSKLTVVVENFQFIGGRDEGDDTDQRPEAYPKTRPAVTKAAHPAAPFTDEEQFKSDDIPFAAPLA